MKTIICAFIVAFSVMSCNSVLKDIDLKLEPIIAVSAFISPQDTLLTVSVDQTLPLGKFKNQNLVDEYVRKCNVQIKSQSEEIQLTFDEERNLFTALPIKFRIEPNSTYQLIVKGPDGKSAKGSCIVPQLPPDLIVEIDSSISITGNSYFAKYQWQDDTANKNFYRIGGIVNITTMEGTARSISKVELGFGDKSGLNTLIADANKNGLIMKGPVGDFQKLNKLGQQLTRSLLTPTTLDAFLLSVDENYFKFHQVILANNASSALSEPFETFSNIEGGLGVFGAYNQRKVNVIVRNKFL